jgi:hypothetical protein
MWGQIVLRVQEKGWLRIGSSLWEEIRRESGVAASPGTGIEDPGPS